MKQGAAQGTPAEACKKRDMNTNKEREDVNYTSGLAELGHVSSLKEVGHIGRGGGSAGQIGYAEAFHG